MESVPNFSRIFTQFVEGALGAPTSIVWIVFYIIFTIFVVYSLLLLYHWLRYGRDHNLIWTALAIYFIVSFILLGTMALSAKIII